MHATGRAAFRPLLTMSLIDDQDHMSSKKHDRYDTNPLACVRRSPIHGHGLFARTKIFADTRIGLYEGRRTLRNGVHVLWLWNEENQRWEGIDGCNELRFLNHSSQPNAEWWGAELYAIRNIEVDEEITFDYGEEWTDGGGK